MNAAFPYALALLLFLTATLIDHFLLRISCPNLEAAHVGFVRLFTHKLMYVALGAVYMYWHMS